MDSEEIKRLIGELGYSSKVLKKRFTYIYVYAECPDGVVDRVRSHLKAHTDSFDPWLIFTFIIKVKTL